MTWHEPNRRSSYKEKGSTSSPEASQLLDPPPPRVCPLPFIRGNISFRESPRSVLYLTRSKSFPYYLLAIALFPVSFLSFLSSLSHALLLYRLVSPLTVFFGERPKSIHPSRCSFSDPRYENFCLLVCSLGLIYFLFFFCVAKNVSSLSSRWNFFRISIRIEKGLTAM